MKAKAVEEEHKRALVTTAKPRMIAAQQAQFDQFIAPWKQRALAICAKHEVDWPDIMKQNRLGKIVRARQEICWDMVVNLGMSFYGVGIKLDRDHTTVLHAVARHKKLLEAQNNERE
jgi:chromosomal replication initiation ATPase DnaA